MRLAYPTAPTTRISATMPRIIFFHIALSSLTGAIYFVIYYVRLSWKMKSTSPVSLRNSAGYMHGTICIATRDPYY
jgi:hypothetical protein